MKPPFLNKRHWSSKAIFRKISDSGWTNPGIDPKYKDFFWADLVSEYDSVNLYHYLYAMRPKLSAYSVQYLDLWFSDEKNHADGFLELNRLLFNMSEESLLEKLKTRACNFERFEQLLSNELSLLTLFAYDEYVSVKTYKKDTFYSDFGSPLFNTWINNLIADEATHFANAIKLLRSIHLSRINEIEKTLQHIILLEGDQYENTFLLDHDGPHFLLGSTNFAESTANEVHAIITRAQK